MAKLKTFVLIGNSNSVGIDTTDNLALADWTRLTGESALTSSMTKPIDVTIPGVFTFVPRLPFGVMTTTTSTASSTGTTLDTADNVFSAGSVGQWVYIRSGTGRGQHRRITAFTDANTVTIASAWTTNLASGDVVELWTDSHTTSGASTTTTMTLVPAGMTVNAFAGKWMVVIDPASAVVLSARKILSNDASTITLETALPSAPAANTGIRILTGANAVNSIADVSKDTFAFRELGYYFDDATSLCTGFDYPSTNVYPQAAPALYNSGRGFGPLPELSWRLAQHLGENVFVIHVAIAGTYVTKFVGDSGLTDFSWFDSATHNDWSPASTQRLTTTTTRDLFAYLVDLVIPAADAWIKQNRSSSDGIDIQGIFSINGEPDALQESRSTIFRSSMEATRDGLRDAIVAGGYSTRAAGKIPFVMSTTHPNTFWPYYDSINEALAGMVEDDFFTGLVDTTDYEMLSDTIHYTSDAQIVFGKDLFDKWLFLLTRESEATQPIADLHTLATLRRAVRLRFERNDASNDAPDDRIDGFINDSLRDIYNTLGDQAYFLRVVESVAVNYPPTTTTLSPLGRRLLRLEDPACPGYPIAWKFLAHDASGRLKILASRGGTLDAHYRIVPKDLSTDQDTTIIPPEHIELVVLLACQRLATSTGNMTLSGLLAQESAKAWSNLKRDCLRMERQRQEPLTTDLWGSSQGWHDPY